MDVDLQKRIDETIALINKLSNSHVDYQTMDPVAKMMLVAMMNEAEKIRDNIQMTERHLIEKYCEHFVPRQLVEAMPSITLLRPSFKTNKENETVRIGKNSLFAYKTAAAKIPLNYIPIFSTFLIPDKDVYTLSRNRLTVRNEVRDICMEHDNCVYVGINTKAEIESLKGFSIFITGTKGLCPARISVGAEEKQLDFATMHDMEDIEMEEPFDAQQSSSKFFSIIESWKQSLTNMDDAVLIYITDDTIDRDLFKPRTFPRIFQQWLESEVLDCFDNLTLWLKLQFPDGYVVTDECKVMINVFPVANVDVNTLMLTQSSPIAKLQKIENSYFLDVIETSNSSQKQGFSKASDEILIRDFDAMCYHDGDLYRDVRNLYNHFVDDYYAFIEYNGIKDGEVLKQLRETINRLGKSVGQKNNKFSFDSGTYAMRNMSLQSSASAVRVNYMTTQGAIGNRIKAGEKMENKKLPLLNKEVEVIAGGMCGADKASADERYELMRYYALTVDRLYTKMDIEAFLRKEIMAKFGKSEFSRIHTDISIAGNGGETKLRRGLYIDISFKDRKNYDHAAADGFDKLLRQKIINKSCISIPIVVELKCLEE